MLEPSAEIETVSEPVELPDSSSLESLSVELDQIDEALQNLEY